jgi:hypothetical protein
VLKLQLSVVLFLTAIIAIGSITPVFASGQLDVTIASDSDIALAKMTYQRTISINYSEGGKLADEFGGKIMRISFHADSSNYGMSDLVSNINSVIAENGSVARVTDLNLDYLATMTGGTENLSVDYKIVLRPVVENFVLRAYSVGSPALVDIDWRGFGADGPVTITTPQYGDVEINIPISLFERFSPSVALAIKSSPDTGAFYQDVMNADGIDQQPVGNWHFLFDPTGIQMDASQHGLSEEIAGSVVSNFTMGESSLREGIQIEKINEGQFTFDKAYLFKSIEASDNANVKVIGFATREVQSDSEVFGISPMAPEGYATTSSGEFPAGVLYGMAGAAAIGGVAIMIVSQRKLKKEKGHYQQTGIDPSQLTGVATSASSGGYQTVRGEAHVKGLEDYNQHKSYYDDKPQVEEKSESESSSTRGSMPKGWKPEK